MTPSVAINNNFTLEEIPIRYNNIELQSDFEIDSHKYKWDSLVSHEFEGESLDTFEDKKDEGDAWIKFFWDPIDEDTSRRDRSPP